MNTANDSGTAAAGADSIQQMAMPTVCACCGKGEDAHHAFVPVHRPPGCRCSVTDWRNNRNIPPVCTKYEVGDCGYYCKTCEHDKECHAA